MNSNKEIGGYFELECGDNAILHNGLYLNSGRNALLYIIKSLNIKSIFVPNYTCPVIHDTLRNEGVNIDLYDINENFMPNMEFPNNSYIIYTNYFGVCGKIVKKLAKKYKNIIIDNSQSFFSLPIGKASFYSPRKFFGLPDGGIAICPCRKPILLDRDISYLRVMHLLKRSDGYINDGYIDFKENDRILGEQPLKLMSQLTYKLMKNINYSYSKKRRLANFHILHKNLRSKLCHNMSNNDVPMVYPLLVKNSEIHNIFIENKIYIAKYWNGVNDINNFSDRILAIPLDQRYNERDMNIILMFIKNNTDIM